MDATALPLSAPPAFARAWIVILAGVIVAAIRLAGPPDLMDNEQQLQSAYITDAIQNHHWLCQRDETGSITSKPPVYTWLAALATLPGGRINRVSATLPSILGNIGLALLLLRFGRKHLTPEAGFFAAMAYLLSYPGARQLGLARMDGLFPFTTTLAAMAAFAAWRRGRGWVWFWLAAAVGTLTKGPVTLVIGAAGLVAILWENRLPVMGAGAAKPQAGESDAPVVSQNRFADHTAGILLFLLITLGWFAASCQSMGRPVYQKLILDGLLGQSVKTHNGHWPGQQFFVPPFYLFSRFLPWSLLACANIWRTLRHPSADDRERLAERFTVCWLVIGIIPFCIASHQRADLIAPMYPPAALLAGRELARLIGMPTRRRTLAFIGGVLAAMLLLALKYDYFARRDINVQMSISARDFARTLEREVGRDFPFTHVDDPYAVQFYLNTMRPIVSYPDAAKLLSQDAPAYVIACHPDALRAAQPPGAPPIYIVSRSSTISGHHGIYVMSNRPELKAQDELAMAVGTLRVSADQLRWVHAAERDFTFAGRGSASIQNAGNKPVEARVIIQRTGQPLGAIWTLQPGERRSLASGG